MFKLTILTLFPEQFPGALGHSLMGKALEKGLWQLETINIRDFANNKHNTVDDTPYGGGAGMVMKADVVGAAIRQAKQGNPQAPVVFLTPAGSVFKQKDAETFAAGTGLILLCGHYEGIDQRVLDTLVDYEISIGDYVLTGGEPAAQVVADAVLRLRQGVVGKDISLHEESHSLQSAAGETLVEYPHYTRPAVWEGQPVPEVLTSGNHAEIARWREDQAYTRTKARRPDLLKTGKKT